MKSSLIGGELANASAMEDQFPILECFECGDFRDNSHYLVSVASRLAFIDVFYRVGSLDEGLSIIYRYKS